MRSFFLGENEIAGDRATVAGELYRHMARVLRLKQGDEVELVDAAGTRYRGVIEEVGAKSLEVRVEIKAPATAEEGLLVTLYQGLPKGEKADLILQKCTELGVSRVVFFDAERSVVKLHGEKGASRLSRYDKIVQEAARQSGRNSVPRVELGGSLEKTLSGAEQEVKLLLWEGEEKTTLRETFGERPPPQSVAVVVGPEGGLSPAEVACAVARGFLPVTLGKRILRTETAGLAMLAILQFHWGDIR